MKMTSAALAAFVATGVIVTLHAQVNERSLPRLMQKDRRYTLLVDGGQGLMSGRGGRGGPPPAPPNR
jgi:thiamine biosynthesis protein ThiC